MNSFLQISISLRLAIERNPYSGAIYIRMTKCSLMLGYLNMYIINGGLIGEIINNNFRVIHSFPIEINI